MSLVDLERLRPPPPSHMREARASAPRAGRPLASSPSSTGRSPATAAVSLSASRLIADPGIQPPDSARALLLHALGTRGGDAPWASIARRAALPSWVCDRGTIGGSAAAGASPPARRRAAGPADRAGAEEAEVAVVL